MAAYALTIFLSAFLLFQVQPLIAKYILPWFGGGPGVWTTCMLFFQVVLLAGYGYAHASVRQLRPRGQVVLHCGLLLVSLVLLPIVPADAWKPDGNSDPTLRILVVLGASVGLPYLVLSATSPLMQQWFRRTNPGRSPYRLFALSNAGSLLALLTFPVWFETHYTRKTQAHLWGWGLMAYAIGCAICGSQVWNAAPSATPSDQPKEPAETTSLEKRILWWLLPACSSILLLATTNKICQDVAVIPFLWVLPLSLYLLSFIISFDSPRWYRRVPFAVGMMGAMAAICWALFQGTDLSIYLQVAIHSAGLFVCCMVCHGELYRLRPEPEQLTGFYLRISAGGAVGGVFVAVGAPLLFKDYFELHWGLLLCGLLFLWIHFRDQLRTRDADYHWFHQATRLIFSFMLTVGLVVLAGFLWRQGTKSSVDVVHTSRNFYGVLTVYEHNRDQPLEHHRLLQHGRITHGLQFLDPSQATWPISYYNEASGVAKAVHALPSGQRRIGVIGLGTGTMAAYGRAGDSVHIYEINPQVKALATSWFNYLSNSPAKIEVAMGDARLSMEREPPERFDLLVLDAFSSDAIPVHLLTREAFALYQRHMQTNGIIAVHVSNHYLDLEPVVANLAKAFNYRSATIDYEETDNEEEWWNYSSTWILLTRSEEVMKKIVAGQLPALTKTKTKRIPLWTDDFVSLFQILRK
jgi:hypothetical protein